MAGRPVGSIKQLLIDVLQVDKKVTKCSESTSDKTKKKQWEKSVPLYRGVRIATAKIKNLKAKSVAYFNIKRH